jgi:hypothetical protein
MYYYLEFEQLREKLISLNIPFSDIKKIEKEIKNSQNWKIEELEKEYKFKSICNFEQQKFLRNNPISIKIYGKDLILKENENSKYCNNGYKELSNEQIINEYSEIKFLKCNECIYNKKYETYSLRKIYKKSIENNQIDIYKFEKIDIKTNPIKENKKIMYLVNYYK